MFSYEDWLRAVQFYIKLGKRVGLTIRQLGFPTKNTLKHWRQEYEPRPWLGHLTSRWGVLVLIALLPGTLRFSDLRRKVDGVSERMLAQTLQWLEGDGMVERRAYKVVPPHVEYTLTSLGQEAAVKVRDLADWIEISMPRIVQSWSEVR